jgi:hypothetical protein
MKCLLAAVLLLAILPVPSATAKPRSGKAPKIYYKNKYVAKPYNKHKKQAAAKYGNR